MVCIGASITPQKHHPLFLTTPPFKSTNFPSPPFQVIPPLYCFFLTSPKVRFFSEGRGEAAHYLSTIRYCEITPLNRNVTSSKHQRNREKTGDMKMSAKHTLHIQPGGYQEPHNEGSQTHPAPANRWDLNQESFKSVCYLLSYQINLPI